MFSPVRLWYKRLRYGGILNDQPLYYKYTVECTSERILKIGQYIRCDYEIW